MPLLLVNKPTRWKTSYFTLLLDVRCRSEAVTKQLSDIVESTAMSMLICFVSEPDLCDTLTSIVVNLIDRIGLLFKQVCLLFKFIFDNNPSGPNVLPLPGKLVLR